MNNHTSPPKVTIWIGRVLSALPVFLLLFSATMKLIKPPGFAEGMAQMGLPARLATPLGLVELICTVLYLVPRTAVLGAILLTGYMGGAICTHVRVGDPFIIQSLLGVLIWLGLYFREPRLRELIPLRRAA